MEYRYDRPLNRSEVLVAVHESGKIHRSTLKERIEKASQKFSFSAVFRHAPDLSLPKPPAATRHSLLILVLDEPLSPRLKSRLDEHLAEFRQISVALAYGSAAAMLAAREEIEVLKAHYKDRVNFLRPDRTEGGLTFVSEDKIVENSVCDSVRIKYVPDRRLGSVALTADEQDYFLSASSLFAECHLYHRSASDGYFLLARDQGFLITATKTYKHQLDLSRISWVQQYDESSRTLRYVGEHLPSSDAVEASVLMAAVPTIRALVHTHASDRWTRNPQFQDKVVVPELPYGEPELGRALAAAVAGRGPSGFVIMQEHGEVFWGRSAADVLAVIRREYLASNAFMPAELKQQPLAQAQGATRESLQP